MKKGFIRSANYERLLESYAQLERRAARERCILLVTGEPGLGKTSSIDRLAVDKNALYVCASALGGSLALLRSLAETQPQINARGSAHAIQQAIIQYLVRAAVPIIVDECQHLIRGADVQMIEALRGISDRAEVPLILVAGELGVETKLARHPQIASRIAQTVEFQPYTAAEVAALARKMIDVTLDDALLIALHERTGGKMRLILEAFQRLEEFGINNGMKIVALGDVKPRFDDLVCREWQASSPKKRKAA